MFRFSLKVCLLYFVAKTQSVANNGSYGNTNEADNRGSVHPTVSYHGWHVLSCVGVFGTTINSFLLHSFYLERKVLATSVNCMICAETFHRILYSAVSVHWRTYNMIMDQPLFGSIIGKNRV